MSFIFGLKELRNRGISKLRFLYSYFKSLIFGRVKFNEFKQVNTFLMFIGYPRSGHSLIASLLDAHPNIIVGMEWGVLPHIRMGYNQNQVFYSIRNNSKAYNKREKNIWTGYSYHVDKMWQGNHTDLYVIGDKMGGQTSMMIKKTPELIGQLEKVIDKPIKYIHVIRNPFDVITTMTKRFHERKGVPGDLKTIDLLPFIKTFFDRVEIISWLKIKSHIEMIDLYQEDLIKNPEGTLLNLLNFINVEYVDGYIQNCSEIVYKKPHKSRYDIVWSDDLIHFVQEEIKKYSFLSHYAYKD